LELRLASGMSHSQTFMERAVSERLCGLMDQRYLPIPTEDDDGISVATRRHRALDMPVSSEVSVSRNTSVWRYVETGWFQAATSLVIVMNIITMVSEAADPDVEREMEIPDQLVLVFYIFELISRALFFKRRFLSGKWGFIAWNILDIVVVCAGVLDQWILPFLPGSRSGPLSLALPCLSFLRVGRILKIVRIFLESDLSWTENARFQSFVGLVIGINSLIMGMETDINWKGWFFFEQVFLTIYVFELAVRMKRFGSSFFSCSNNDVVWNILDFMIVISSSIDSWVLPAITAVVRYTTGVRQSDHHGGGMSFGQAMMLMRMLRLMRILRLVKLVKAVRPLYILVTSILVALQGVAWVLVLTVVVLYAMGIVSTRLIGHGMLFAADAHVPDHVLAPFKTVPESMFTLFRVMSGAASTAQLMAIDELMVKLPVFKFGFVFFMISSAWTLLSILTAVVSENMISTTGLQEHEMKLASDEEDRAQHTVELQALFRDIDLDGDGTVDESELIKFLSNKENAMNCARSCRVPVRDVRMLLKDLATENERIDMGLFTECLLDVGKPVTEKAVMKLEARMCQLQRRTEQLFQQYLQRDTESLFSSQPEKTDDRWCCFRDEKHQDLLNALHER